MAKNPPKTKEEFLKIKGVNEQKYKQWGEIFIKAIEKALVSAEESETVISTCSTTAIEKAENSADSFYITIKTLFIIAILSTK